MIWRIGVLGVLIGWTFTAAYSQPHTLQVFDTGNSLLPENNIRALAIAPDSALWVGTENGLVTLNNGVWDVIDTFDTYQIRAIAFDSSGHAWVGTFLNGLWVETDTGWTNHTTANSPLPADYVRAIAFCPNGDAWLGTVGGAARISNGVWTAYNEDNTNWYTEHIAAAYCSPTNQAWLGGINSGLMRQQDTSWTVYRTGATGLPDNTVLDLQAGTNDALWLAMPAAGTAVFDGNQGWVVYNTISSFNPTNSINKLAVGNDGRMYFASADKGLVVYKGGLDWFNLSATTRPDTTGAYLPDNELFTVVQDAEGVVWTSANNMGLLRIEFLDSTTSVLAVNPLADLLLYPNPATDYLIVQSAAPNLEITFADITGRIVHTKVSSSLKTKVPLSGLPRGTYMVVIISYGARVAHRVVVY